RSRTPVVAVAIAKCTAMTRASDKSSGLVCYRIVRRIRKRSQRMVSHQYSVGIYVPFRTRSGILIVVFAVVFSHPWSFGVGTDGCVHVILSRALPSVLLRMQTR